LFCECWIFYRYHAGGHIAMSTQILGRGVNDNICAQIQRILQVWRHQAVVHRKQRAMLMDKISQSRYIDDPQQGIGWCLNMNEASSWANVPAKALEIRRVAVANLNSAAVQDLGKQTVAAAVEIVTGEDLISRTQQPCHCRNCRDAT